MNTGHPLILINMKESVLL